VIEFQAKNHQYILVDTSGQLELFLWSPSGKFLLNSLSSRYRVLLSYVVDTPQSSLPTMFMSDMQYAHSILEKFALPTVVVCNKTDIPFTTDWIESVDDVEHSNLLGYMAVVLEKFSDRLDIVSVSSITGAGILEFLGAVHVRMGLWEFDKAVGWPGPKDALTPFVETITSENGRPGGVPSQQATRILRLSAEGEQYNRWTNEVSRGGI